MHMSDSQVTVDDLWIERVSRSLGFEVVAERLTGTRRWGPHLFIVAVVGVYFPVLSVVGWFRTGVLSIAVNPGELFGTIAWPATVWILFRTKRRYTETVQNLPDAIDEDVQELDTEWWPTSRLLTFFGVPTNPSGKPGAGLEQVAPRRVWYSILCSGLLLYGWQLVTNYASLVEPVAANTGLGVAIVRFYVIIPFVFYPIGAELLTVIVGALVFLPFKIRRARLVDFSDPHGSAGLAPAGEMFKNVVVSYFIVLTLFLLFQTVAVGASPTDQLSTPVLLAGLLAGLVLFFGPLLWLRTFIAAAKEAKIESIAEKSREVGPTENLPPYAEPESIDDANQYTYNSIRIQRVKSTSEFPVNIGMVQEVVLALVLPYLSSFTYDFVV